MGTDSRKDARETEKVERKTSTDIFICIIIIIIFILFFKVQGP